MIQFVNTFFSTISEISEKFYHIAKIRSLFVVNDIPRSFLLDNQRGRSHLMLSLGYKVDAALFGLLWIQSFRKKVANCKFMHCQDAREYPSMCFCGLMSRCFAGYPE
jgi:hypothetical protein